MFKGAVKPKGPSAHLTQTFGASLLDATGKSVDTASVIRGPKSSPENFFDLPANSAARVTCDRMWAKPALILV